MKYIIAIGIFQAALAAIMLWRSKFRNSADSLLVMLIACIGVHLSIKFFIYSVVTDAAVLSMMNTFVAFCYLPLLYLYTLKTIRPDFVPASRWYVFIPFVLGSITYFSAVSVLIVASDAGYNLLNWYNKFSFWSLTFMDIAFSVNIMILVKKHLPKASKEGQLIVQVARLFLLMGFLAIVFSLIYTQSPLINYTARGIIYGLLIVVCILIVKEKYVAFISPMKEGWSPKQQEQLTGDSKESLSAHPGQTVPFQNDLSTNKHQSISDKKRTTLKEEDLLSIVLKVETAMNVECYYKDSELTLDKLAGLISQNKYHLSEALNHCLGKPFYTFVNEYRIRHVITKLERLSKNDLDVNMLTLAYDAGFNSKSSFNRYFKDITGETPTTYYKKMIEEDSFPLCLNTI